MSTIAQNERLVRLPAAELERSLREFLAPVTRLLPEARLRAVTCALVQGIASSQSPLVTQIARGLAHTAATVWPTSKRGYRFLANPRCDQRTLVKGLYGVAQRAVATQRPEYLVVAVDPVNFEKPYTRRLEGVSTVLKSTPPSLNGEKRLTRGYPALTATVVNLAEPATSYAHWFSYVTADFVSENRELYRALRTTRAVFRDRPVRFVGDAGLDDQKLFAQVARLDCEFVIRACHNRRVEVYNDRLAHWESELLFDLTASVPFACSYQVCFTHARRTRLATLHCGWLPVRLPATQQPLGVVVVHESDRSEDLVLLTNVPLPDQAAVRRVYSDWRLRGRVEHGYRFDQEAGLDVEDMRVQTLERMQRLFILVLLAAQFVFYIGRTWPSTAVCWLRQLGGHLGRPTDREGPYVLLRGISAVWQAVATCAFLAHHPFPCDEFT